MRRRTLISAIFISAAWLIIFLHAVIPHNHHDEHAIGCRSVYHCCHDSHDSDHDVNAINNDGLKISDESFHSDDSHFICHFTAGPAHTLDNDTPYMPTRAHEPGERYEVSIEGFSRYDAPFLERQQCTTRKHRGPPSLMG